jgi:hypothetical protein
MAVHAAPAGPGLAISSVSTVTDGKAAARALDSLVGMAGELIKAAMTKEKKPPPRGLKVDRKAFSHKQARGTLLRLRVPRSMLKKAEAEANAELAALIVEHLALGWAHSDKELYLTLGKGAEQQLKVLVEGKPEKGLPDNAAFAAAARADKGRVGLLYISPIDALRSIQGLGIKQLTPLTEALGDKPVSSAPSLDWGVNQNRTEMDVTLRLPMEQLELLVPALMAMQKGASPGGTPAWRDL